MSSVTKIAGGFHIARKEHACDHYFSKQCAGSGTIAKGDRYWSPDHDCKTPFHPYRVCTTCERTHNV